MSTMTLSPTIQTPVRPAQRGARSQVRLTQRGRLVVFVAAMLFVLAAAVFLGTSSMATNHAGVDQPTRAVTVQPGDTLWAIAADVADDGEVRDMVHTIKQLNALDSSMLVAGQQIYVPLD
ncbi:LysM peptidoglycan-binding domain-containing protein [Nocardioides sp. Root140]|uniref:LysM peptidoglycan-binding domain-containing protein n=1 Tax=Nocardioides sp. Root140 TaxID=1736460 RepID=UPI0006FDD8E1|nr:LysM peptidoglycan-binding domain-containing protein [Nocardioides sp. Root140]KQY56723.1 hypothetical protein ASD30_10440 [Nocardioides sp. Root140]